MSEHASPMGFLVVTALVSGLVWMVALLTQVPLH
jgi:hypothetical protein